MIQYVLFFLSSHVFAQSRCDGLFPNLANRESVALFRQFVDREPRPNVEYLRPKDVHIEIIRLSESPRQAAEIAVWRKAIARAEEKVGHPSIKVDHPAVRDSYLVDVHHLKELLQLVEGDLKTWKEYLASDQRKEEYRPGTAGHLLERLPQYKKDELLLFLGKRWSENKDRSVVNTIHILLNPGRVRKEIKEQGGTDLEFYDAYLRLVKEKVFPDLDFGGYSGSFVVENVRVMEKFLKDQNMEGSLVYFGSGPNGFARPGSDYDLFRNNFPFFDSTLKRKLEEVTAGTPHRWELDDSNFGKFATENFGSEQHPFLFVIERGRLILRFFPQRHSIDRNGDAVDNRYEELHLHP